MKHLDYMLVETLDIKTRLAFEALQWALRKNKVNHG